MKTGKADPVQGRAIVSDLSLGGVHGSRPTSFQYFIVAT